jgi:hypothetical protein
MNRFVVTANNTVDLHSKESDESGKDDDIALKKLARGRQTLATLPLPTS